MTVSDTARRFPISLVMIVRDEERCLARCLESVAGLVDEIVIVDTGSTDGTVAIADSFGATVSHFTWIDDFAAARNFALAQASHPWRLVLDADEWLIDREASRAALDAIGRTEPSFIGLLDEYEALPSGALNTAVVPFQAGRLLPPDVTYAGRVHEQPTPRNRLEPVGLTFGHDGYLPSEMARKEDRNTSLLVAAINEDPDDAYLWYQLGSEFVARGDDQGALPHLVQAFNLLHPDATTTPAPTPQTWWHRLTVRLIRTLSRTGRHEEALALSEMEASQWSESPDFHYAHGNALRAYAAGLDEAQDELAGQLILASHVPWQRAAELDDRPEYTGTLTTRASVLAAKGLAEDLASMGRMDEAQRYLDLASARSSAPGP